MSHSQVIPCLWIGNDDAPLDEDFLSEEDIRFILDLTRDLNRDCYEFNNLQMMGIKLQDQEFFTKKDLKLFYQNVQDASKLIDTQIKSGKNILVHCHMGINRSALVIGHYLITYRGYSASDAIEIIEQANQRRDQNVTLFNLFFRDCLIQNLFNRK